MFVYSAKLSSQNIPEINRPAQGSSVQCFWWGNSEQLCTDLLLVELSTVLLFEDKCKDVNNYARVNWCAAVHLRNDSVLICGG